MRTQKSLAWLICLTLLADVAQSGPVERPVPFHIGERLEYDVSWSNYVSAGTVVLQVAEKRPSFSSMAYYIAAEATPSSLVSRIYTLYYKADTLLDVYSLLPQRGSIYSREGKRQRMKVTSFDHGAKRARFDMQTTTTMTRELSVSPVTHDALSAIYALRAAPLRPGDHVRMPISDGGHLYQADFAVGGVETLKIGGVDMQALRIVPAIRDEDGKAVGGGATLWVTNDARHVPLRLEAPLTAGRFVLSLRRQATR